MADWWLCTRLPVGDYISLLCCVVDELTSKVAALTPLEFRKALLLELSSLCEDTSEGEVERERVVERLLDVPVDRDVLVLVRAVLVAEIWWSLCMQWSLHESSTLDSVLVIQMVSPLFWSNSNSTMVLALAVSAKARRRAATRSVSLMPRKIAHIHKCLWPFHTTYHRSR